MPEQPEGPSPADGRQRRKTAHDVDGSSHSDSFNDDRFVPGMRLAGRYRIIGLLGKGGMGEVYKAEDLKLGQTVALKFLPESLASDGGALARFHREARVARQITHPNVCRVHDIGEIEGQPFLSMEYIDGEDLSSLLRRIGRLPANKAVEIARQLCSGLAAAHDAGVLHRDLKPANVMLDGRGRARITDFGLAGVAEELGGEDAHAGTPAYMAPEQLTGKGVTVRSDLYALGLVLYEIFTGKRAFVSSDLAELVRLQEQTTPTSPSSLVKDIDPLVERVILRCLESDPHNRPASALQVAAALPGGDPLAAALAAGETPSPEMVAAAPKEGTLRPVVAAALLASVLLGLTLIVILSGKVMLHALVPLRKSPDVLTDRATSIINKLGYTAPPAESVFGFGRNVGYLRYVMEHDSSPTRWDKLASGQPSAIYFWHRQSPRSLEPSSLASLRSAPRHFWHRQSPRSLEPGNHWDVSSGDPPLLKPGMVSVLLDTEGRLIRFDAVPPLIDDSPGPSGTPNWSILFTEAGLNIENFKPVDAREVPTVGFDQRAAWEGVFPNQPDIPMRVEAAGFKGKPAHFAIHGPWSRLHHAQSNRESGQESGRAWAFQVFFLVSFILFGLVAALLARRNLRQGRGDRKGAFRLAVYIFVVTALGWVLGANHIPTSFEIDGLNPVAWTTPIAWALYAAFGTWLIYIALEPYVRQRWPHRIIAWSRLLAGDIRDPLIGRYVLMGGLFGVIYALLDYLRVLLPKWLGWPPSAPISPNLSPLRGMRGVADFFFGTAPESVIAGLGALFGLLTLSILFRREWLAVAAYWFFITIIGDPRGVEIVLQHGARHFTDYIFAGLIAALWLFVLLRFGLLATVTVFIFSDFRFYPLTSDLSVWYSGSTAFALLVTVALAVYGFYTSLAGQPLFREHHFTKT
ncbi:MAG: serine/threonine protein kinase [Acidobacteria bacterium]|nr:serine/threonine protein kinase [Acidobacteriota bacterium]